MVYIQANHVVVWNTSNGKKDYLPSTNLGYTCCTANSTKGQIAAAEYGLNPEVNIYQFPTNKLIAKIPTESKISIQHLAFSRHCDKLLIIGDKPGFKI